MAAKWGPVIRVTREALEDNPWTLERLIAAQERAHMARQRRLEDEVVLGAHLNPCIEMGVN